MGNTASNGGLEEKFTSEYGGRLFLGLSVGWATLVFGRQLLPPLLPTIIEDIGISPFQAGTALTVLWAARALNQYPGGRLADRLTRKTVLVGGLGILTIGFVLLIFSVDYPLFLLSLVIIGLGAGAYSVSTRTTVADIFVARRGKAFGVQTALNNVASVTAAGGAILIMSMGNWRGAFLPVALVLFSILLAVHKWNRDPYILQPVDLGFTETARRVFGNVEIRRVITAFLLWMFAWQGFIGFLPTFLQVEKQFSPVLASAGFALVFIIGIGAGPIVGGMGDQYGKLPIIAGSLIFGVVGLIIILLMSDPVLISGGIIILSVGFRSFGPLTQAYLMDVFSETSMGGDLGAGKTIWGGIGSIGPAYVGFVSGSWNYTFAYLGLVACLLLSLLLVILVWFKEH